MPHLESLDKLFNQLPEENLDDEESPRSLLDMLACDISTPEDVILRSIEIEKFIAGLAPSWQAACKLILSGIEPGKESNEDSD